MADMNEISELLQKGKAKEVRELVEKALAEGENPETILNEGLLSGMAIIGEKFKKNEIYVPEVLIAARAMNQATEVLEPALVDAGVKPKATVVIGTVKGDLHDIGKNLVGMMLKGGGFKVVDLGIDVSPEDFVAKARESGAQLMGLSALLTTTMPAMKDIVAKARDEGLDAKVMIGGAPVTQAYADEIGAHGYAPDAVRAVRVAQELAGT